MKKIQRLIELMMAVNERMRFTVKEMAEQFGVSERTMHRDLQELCELGMPLYTEFGPHGGYRLLKKRILPPILFSEQEAAAMFFAVQSLQYFGTLPFEAESESALSKFYHHLPEDTKARIRAMKSRVSFWSPTRTQSSPWLEQILKAAIDRRAIGIVYDSRQGPAERTVLPIGIYAHNGFWYAPSYCYDKQAHLLFRADRILAVDEQVALPARTPDYLQDYTLDDWLENSEKLRVADPQLSLRVRFTREGIRAYERTSGFGGTLELDADGGGLLTAPMHAENIAYFGKYFLSFGADAIVQEPAEMLLWIQNELQALTQAYCSSST